MRYRFADCSLDTSTYSLTRGGVEERIEPQVFDLLHLLARNAGNLVTRDHMIEEIWQGRIVSESAISARIAAARRAVGDNGAAQAVIRTVPRRGMLMVAEVEPEGAGDQPVTTADTSPPPVAGVRQTIRYATADDGVKLAYAVTGDGPPLVRIAHFPTHLELEWQDYVERPLLDALSEYRTLVRLDQRGAGLSDIEVEDFGIERAAEDIGVVADAAGFDRFALFGSSSGGMVAARFAATYPDRVTHLALLGGYVDGRSVRGDNEAQGRPEPIKTMVREGWDAPGNAFIRAYMSLYFPTASSDMLDHLARIIYESCPAENALHVREASNTHSIAGLLAQITAPTLVMHARNDAVHPLSEARKMAAGIPGAELLVLETANHYPLPGEPAWRVQLDAMLEFLARHP